MYSLVFLFALVIPKSYHRSNLDRDSAEALPVFAPQEIRSLWPVISGPLNDEANERAARCRYPQDATSIKQNLFPPKHRQMGVVMGIVVGDPGSDVAEELGICGNAGRHHCGIPGRLASEFGVRNSDRR